MDEIQSPEITELVKALHSMQHQLKAAKKTRENPFYKASYADLNSIVDTLRKPLFENDLSFFQSMMVIENRDILVTQLNHNSGQWIRSYYPIYPTKNDPQAHGSAVSYAKRYSLAALCGLVSEGEDDDGEGAMVRDDDVPEEKPKPPDDLCTEPQRKKIYAMCKNTGVSDAEAKEWMSARYKVESSKDLTKKQASDFIEFLTEIEKQQ